MPAALQLVSSAPPRRHHKVVGPKLPEGVSPEAMGRQALALRQELPSIAQVARRLGIATQACQQMMDIVRIADRTDLPERDAALAKLALAEMNTRVGTLTEAYARVAPIAARLWGETDVRRSRPREKMEQHRLEQFERAMGVICAVCANAAELELPHLTEERLARLRRDLKRAVANVKKLQARTGEVSL